MRLMKTAVAACVVITAGAGATSAQVVEPFKVLEEARRDRIEMDKRLAREAAARRQKEKADQAAQLKRDKEAAAAGGVGASGTPAAKQAAPRASKRPASTK